MSSPESNHGGDVSTGELSRRVSEVFARISELVKRLEEQFISKALFDIYVKGVEVQDRKTESEMEALRRDKSSVYQHNELERRVKDVEEGKISKGSHESLGRRVDTLESDKAGKTDHDNLAIRVTNIENTLQWLNRLIIAFVIASILGAVYATGKGAL